ncbi:MAG: multidrug transporter [Rhodanobacter sp. SCN 68-63]|mgnify:CR=1 FL=1|nr:MAG: multidrug transporter [Rhodanobacter sp. SCN 68-63]
MSRSMHRLALAALIAGALGVTGAARAGDFPSTPPPPAAAPQLNVPTPASQTLPNGLRVISVRRAGLPLVTAQLLIRRGGEMDPPGEAGLASLTANLLTKGAAGKTAPQIAAAAEALGGTLNASASWDESGVGITVTTPRLGEALALLADVVRRPTFADDELSRACAQALDDLQLMLSRPTTLASLVAARSVFGDGAYGHSRSGTPASLKRVTRADVVQLHQALYRPDNAILVLTGDITPAQATELARASFGDWKAPATPLPKAPATDGRSTLPHLLVIDQAGAGQAGVVAAHVAPPRSDADFYVGTVANAVLGGSYSARLNEEIRIKRGLSYGASSSFDPRRGSGLWLAAAQTKNPSATQVVTLMQGEFDRLGSTPVGADELAARKATLVGEYGRSLETTSGLARQVGELAVYGVDLADIGRYIERVQAVTPAQIQRYAQAHLGETDRHVVVVGDAAQFGAALMKAHPHGRQLSAKALDLDSSTLQPPAPTTTR